MSIVIRSLCYTHPDREILFENINLSISTGTKAALAGNNGAGKSTLLQLIAGDLKAAAGDLILSEQAYYVPQHLGQYDHLSIAGALKIDKKLNALRAILEGDASPEHFNNLEDDWDIEEKAQNALAFWHLGHLGLEQKMETLSGGEKNKVFLAGIQIHSPGVILLDEPSNHIDLFSRELLYDFIKKSKATILIASHDRALLNLLDITLELSKSGIELFGGNFDFYREQKELKLNALQLQFDEQSKTLKQAQQKARDLAEQRQKKEARGKAQGLTQSLPRIVANGLRGKAEQTTAKIQDTHSEKINGISDDIRQVRQQIQQYQVLKIDLRESGLHQGKMLINAQNINFGYEKKSLWDTPLSFQIRSGNRVKVEGKNGSGKTSLLKIIMGVLQPNVGGISRADFKYLYLDQEYSAIANQLSVFEQLQECNNRHLQEHDLKSLLHYYQFSQEMWDRKCESLSGGEKMKLSLCCLAASNKTPDLLVLDEPTNNLDLQSLEILSSAVKGFNGTLILISHDLHFVEEVGIDMSICL